MNFEVLKRSHVKRNIIIAIVIVLVLSAIILTFTRAKYRTTQSMPLLNGTINYTLADLNIVAMYLDGEQVDTLPDGNYELTEESYCTNEENVRDESITLNYDGSTNTFTVAPFSKKGTKCYLYFEEGANASETILANKTEGNRGSFNNAYSADTTGKYFTTIDWTGNTTYYFAGNPTDNWLQFAGFYWKIIRINGDGTIRLIYNGTSTTSTGTNTQINGTTYRFNNANDNNMYVGFMYTENDAHGLENSSNAKVVLDNWYNVNLSKYENYLNGNIGFCGDRTIYTGTGIGSGYNNFTYYSAYNRLYSNSSPSLQCDSRDIYTTKESSTGNKALTYPVGLITADEVVLAGLPWNSRGYTTTNYLYTGQAYWTMTPYYYYSSNAMMFDVNVQSALYNADTNTTLGIRPVINLRADVQITGSGTTSDPFKVVEA